jgi:Low molecular weight phosphotyrosine protein phosphatase
VPFICSHNAGHSSVAALNTRQLPGVAADSAGTDPADTLTTTVVAALAERGISLTGVHPKTVTAELLAPSSSHGNLSYRGSRCLMGCRWGYRVGVGSPIRQGDGPQFRRRARPEPGGLPAWRPRPPAQRPAPAP